MVWIIKTRHAAMGAIARCCGISEEELATFWRNYNMNCAVLTIAQGLPNPDAAGPEENLHG